MEYSMSDVCEQDSFKDSINDQKENAKNDESQIDTQRDNLLIKKKTKRKHKNCLDDEWELMMDARDSLVQESYQIYKKESSSSRKHKRLKRTYLKLKINENIGKKNKLSVSSDSKGDDESSEILNSEPILKECVNPQIKQKICKKKKQSVLKKVKNDINKKDHLTALDTQDNESPVKRKHIYENHKNTDAEFSNLRKRSLKVMKDYHQFIQKSKESIHKNYKLKKEKKYEINATSIEELDGKNLSKENYSLENRSKLHKGIKRKKVKKGHASNNLADLVSEDKVKSSDKNITFKSSLNDRPSVNFETLSESRITFPEQDVNDLSNSEVNFISKNVCHETTSENSSGNYSDFDHSVNEYLYDSFSRDDTPSNDISRDDTPSNDTSKEILPPNAQKKINSDSDSEIDESMFLQAMPSPIPTLESSEDLNENTKKDSAKIIPLKKSLVADIKEVRTTSTIKPKRVKLKKSSRTRADRKNESEAACVTKLGVLKIEFQGFKLETAALDDHSLRFYKNTRDGKIYGTFPVPINVNDCYEKIIVNRVLDFPSKDTNEYQSFQQNYQFKKLDTRKIGSHSQDSV